MLYRHIKIQYDIIYDIGYDIGISVYVTCLHGCMNRKAWWWRSCCWQWKWPKSPVELLLGHIIMIRHGLKKAGKGSKVGSRSLRNVWNLIFIIAHFICIHLPIPVKIIVGIRCIFVVGVRQRSTWRKKDMSVPLWKPFPDIGSDIVNIHRPISECIPILHFPISGHHDTISWFFSRYRTRYS